MKGWSLAAAFLPLLLYGADMKKYQREAEVFGKEYSKMVRDFAIEEMTPKGEAPFDPERTQEENEVTVFIKSDDVQKNIRDNSHLNEEEYFFKRSEDLIQGLEEVAWEENEEQSHLETCRESAEPYPIVVYRTLTVEGTYEPEQRTLTKVCCGHKKKKDFFWKSDAKEWCHKRKKKLSQDPEIKEYDVDYSGSVSKDYVAKATWAHVDNAASCDHFEKREQVVPERWEETLEKWAYENQEQLALISSPDCTLIEQACVDPTPRNINGKLVEKPCWREKLLFLRQLPKSGACSFLREKNCMEVKRKCVQESPYGCALWEITYKCVDKMGKRSLSMGKEGLFELEVNKEYEPNQSFSSVYIKMKLFEEIKGQLEMENIEDASKIPLFKGKKLKCSKSVADKLLYDCCFSFSGLAKEMRLSQCSEEERELGVLRKNEQCHYVGKYEKEFMDLWKSQDVHVYCCFPSKLARVFQEQARTQLGLDWGKAKEPNCRGLLASEIEKVDFSKLDLSECFDVKAQDVESKLKPKLESIKIKLQEKMAGMET